MAREREFTAKRRKHAILAFAILAIFLTAALPLRSLASLPYHLRVTRGHAQELARHVPVRLYVRADRDGALRLNGGELAGRSWRVVDRGKLAIEPLQDGRYHLDMRLFALIPIRRITVDVISPVMVVPGGESIGVLVNAEGVLVVGTEALRAPDGSEVAPARASGIQPGDVILAVNGRKVGNKEAAAALIAGAGSGGEAVRLTVRRGDDVMEKKVVPAYDIRRQRYLIGLWIKDGASGVGTLTFYDARSGRYGALGHVVSDGSGRPYDVSHGAVVPALISGIRPGRPGQPGEKIGIFLDQDAPLGSIDKNTQLGIFGRLLRPPAPRQAVPVALEGEVREGPAQVITVINGQRPEAFDAVIERVFPQDRPSDKGMVVRITDPRLLAAAGGIVQGMSGSPIMQGGKLAGAITHVFVSDPTRGYGVFAEWMVRELTGGTLRVSVRSGAALAALGRRLP